MSVIVLLGNTGVGKDTLASGLMSQMPYMSNFKMVSALKRQWERELDIPYGSLDLRVVKNTTIPGYGLTYGQWMVNEFHKSERDPYYRKPLLRRMKRELNWFCDNNITPICTDIRMPDEVATLVMLADPELGYSVNSILVYLLSRDEARPLTADVHLMKNVDTFECSGYAVRILQHNGTTEQWLSQIVADVESLRQVSTHGHQVSEVYKGTV